MAAARAASEDEVAFAKRRLDWAANELLGRRSPFRWSDFATLGKLPGRWRPILEGYAYMLFDRPREAAIRGDDAVQAPEFSRGEGADDYVEND